MTEITDIRAGLERIVTLLTSIDYRLEQINSLLNGVIKHGEAAPFIEWATPESPECRKDQA